MQDQDELVTPDVAGTKKQKKPIADKFKVPYTGYI